LKLKNNVLYSHVIALTASLSNLAKKDDSRFGDNQSNRFQSRQILL